MAIALSPLFYEYQHFFFCFRLLEVDVATFHIHILTLA
jgi:hypothetical protein